MASNASSTVSLPVPNNYFNDPLQGFDIKIMAFSGSMKSTVLAGGFTALMVKIVNQTETYMPVGTRIPRMLDGEIITVWSMEQGLVNRNLIANTFGAQFAAGYAGGRGAVIPRSLRFNIVFAMDPMVNNAANDDYEFYYDGTQAAGLNANALASTSSTNTNIGGTSGLQLTDAYQLSIARIDTFSFGIASGRHVAANSWQGTAEYIKPIQVTGLYSSNTNAGVSGASGSPV